MFLYIVTVVLFFFFFFSSNCKVASICLEMNADNINQSAVSEDEANVQIMVMINDWMDDIVFDGVSQNENFSNIMDFDGICRAPGSLRSLNPEAYNYHFIPIGLLGTNDFSDTFEPCEMMKFCYVRKFLSVVKVEMNEITRLVIDGEKRALECYIVDDEDGNEIRNMCDDNFAEPTYYRANILRILICNGCFVVMYMLCSLFPVFLDNDTSYFFWNFKDAVFRDLLLLQNQLPFFLLESLYGLCASNNQPLLGEFSFIHLTHQFFMAREDMSYLRKDFTVGDHKLEVNHFVQFLSHMNFTAPPDSSKLLDRNTPLMLSVWPPNATELYNSGIFFKKRLFYSQKVFDERAGILRVPHIIINKNFEIMMRNIIAYEHRRRSRPITNFVMFMHFLLNSDSDVSLLVKEGIIQNHLENTKEVTKLFQDLCEKVVMERNLYNSDCERIKEYCKHRRHWWMALLKRDYFNSPWALISFIAAVVLLLLTLMQAVVAVLSMPKSK